MKTAPIGNGRNPPTSAVRHVVVKGSFGVMTNYGLSSVTEKPKAASIRPFGTWKPAPERSSMRS